jgi:arsenate reductase-like glutaredoxin family protein
MPKITINQKPTCTTCRQVYNALKESGVDFKAVDYQLYRYITRPAIANERLKRNRAGQVVLQLKSPY